MKTRTGFVSNSSSSSFVLKTEYVSVKQLGHIENHIAYANLKWPGEFFADERDAWDISICDDRIHGYTDMDNFDMAVFLDRIGIPSNAVSFERD